MIRPRQLSRLGEFYLEEAILDVLLEARHEDQCIGAAAISRRAGIFREPGHAQASGNDNIVWGMLNKLVKENKVKRCPQNPAKPDKSDGWELTDEEFDRRKDDISE